ncbi:MAG: 16S rRNA (adenine(1518)-N(6)/adenine(1519)-N(6))-dimethyltransferase RsmA [Parcubacteria group bacterium]
MNRPKKSLGQNFLRDEKVLQKIINISALNAAGFVIEIGPGEGVLTEQLAQYAEKVIAIELDGELVPALAEKFKNNPNVEIIHEDILKINLPELLEKNQPSTPRAYKVVANIPYYITSPIIRLFLEQTIQPEEIILMIQKEVAERIVAGPGQGSILSVSVQYYATAEIMFAVGKQAFFPVPKVDSAVIKIIPTRKFDKDQDKAFFRIVKAGFSAKRKTLLNNLSNSLQLDKSAVEEKLQSLGIAPTARAQELSLEKWKEIASQF